MMKKSAVYSALCAVSACVFLFSTGMTYASWQVQNDTINIITMASVRGQIVEEYEQNTVVYPDSTVNKIVQVQNTGNIDAMPRVKIEKAWGDIRDEDGRLIVNPDLSTDNIKITYNTQSWIYRPEDGYFYYYHVLEPGEITESLFNSFMIDEATTGSEYRNKEADIVVNLEIIQASDEALSFWGTSYEELGVIYQQTERIELVTKVDFNDPEKGFTFDVNSGDLFADFKNLIPGEARSQIVEITNLWDHPVEIYFWADYIDQEHADERTKELVYQMLHEYAVILITDEDGSVIYNGPIWGNPDVDSTGTDSMKYPFDLGEFSSGMAKQIHVGLRLDSQMDNEDLALLGLIKWVFSAQGADEAIVDPPVSSDVISSDTTEEKVTTTDETISTDNSTDETETSVESTSSDNTSVETEFTTTPVSTSSSSNGTETETTPVSTSTLSNGTETETTSVSTSTLSNGTETETTSVSTSDSSNATEDVTTTISTGITTYNSSTEESESTTETMTTMTDETSESSETDSGTTKVSSNSSSAVVTTGNSSSSTRSSGGNNLTSTDYLSSPQTRDSFKIIRYAILAVVAFITMTIMYRKAKDESEQSDDMS